MSQISLLYVAGSHTIVNQAVLCKTSVRTWLKNNNTNTTKWFFMSIW